MFSIYVDAQKLTVQAVIVEIGKKKKKDWCKQLILKSRDGWLYIGPVPSSLSVFLFKYEMKMISSKYVFMNIKVIAEQACSFP